MSFASASIYNTQFSNSASLRGIVIYTGSLMNQKIKFENSSITDIISQNPTSNLVEVLFGSLIIRNLSLYNITSSIFSTKGVSIDIDSMHVDSIFCLGLHSFCILEGPQSNSSLSNLAITNVRSSSDLLDLSQSADYIRIFNSTFSDIMPLNNSGQVFVFRMACPYVTVRDSLFNNLYGFSSLSVQNSQFNLTNNIFYNDLSSEATQRIFRENRDLGLPRSQFLSLASSYGIVKNNSFTMNSLSYSLNGGVSYLILTITLIVLRLFKSLEMVVNTQSQTVSLKVIGV